MTFKEFLDWIGLSTTSFWGIVVFLTSIGIELIPKFKWNPWSALFKWIGSRFNAKIDEKMDAVRGELKVLDKKIDFVDQKIDRVQGELSKHITESNDKSLQDTRRDILEFCNSCMNGRRHTKEQFDFMIKQCDEYEEYIKSKKIKNGVIEAAIQEIRRLYAERIHKNDFMKEGESS